jgi:protein PhnA
MVVKRGTRARGIRLSSDDPTHVQAKVDGQTIFLKTEFLKK